MSFDEFIRQFPIVIPWRVLIWSCSAAAVASIASLIFAPKAMKCRLAVLAWMLACIVVMVDVTVFSRTPGASASRFMTPLWSLGDILEGNIWVISEKVYNILFFMPFGLLCGLFFRQRTLSRSLLAGLCLSAAIELLQLVTSTGTCELDDVICNLIGCFAGALFAELIFFRKFVS